MKGLGSLFAITMAMLVQGEYLVLLDRAKPS